MFPEGSQQIILNSTWPVCDAGAPLLNYITERTLALCHAGELTMQEWMLDSMAVNAEVPYGWIQSKTDSVQIAFFVAVATTLGIPPLVLTPAAFYEDSNAILVGYESAPNAVQYLVQSDQHTYDENNLVYTTTTEGTSGGGTGMTLIEWIADLLASGSAQLGTSQCYGDLEDEAAWSGTKYCASSLAGKVFRPQ